MKRLLQTLFSVALMSLFHACSGSGDKQANTIMVTIEPIRYFTEQIAGDKFTVTSMVPSGSSPETYDPTPRQLTDLSGSRAYLRIGYIGFEQTWMARLRENAPRMKVYDLSRGVSLIRETEHAHGDHVHQGGVEPHIWNSPTNARIIAQNIYQTLCELDAANKDYYEANLRRLIQEIEQTDHAIRDLLAQPHDGTFLIYHPALSYYARDYQLRQICLEENGKEPSVAHLKELINRCQTEHVRTIFVQKEFDSRNAELIANETGAKIVSINPLSYEWRKELIETTKALCHE